MGKVTKISVRHARTINMGNYQSLNVEVSMEADVAEHEKEFDVFQEVTNRLHTAFEFELNRSIEEFQKQSQ